MSHKFVCTPTEPVVVTAEGRLRGFQLDDIYTFYGIPYADADRFQAPHPAAPWEGVRDALSYGYVCPLLTQEKPDKEQLVPHRYWPMDEHCLNLNVWTPSLDPAARKPVMVWLHGGGYWAGSAIEQVAYEGDHLAAYGDVVVVTVNHRLNLLGYLDLSSYGEKYKNSANAGNADLVAALEWVHRNIAAFGGDPGNVTIFGQSGGGEKVIALMNTPAADGLFHKGIVESGVTPMHSGDRENGRPLVQQMLAALGLGEDEVEKLETVPYPALAEAYLTAVRAVRDTQDYVGSWPVPNDWYCGHPLSVGFTEHARTIPLLIGSVMGEFCFDPGVQNKYTLPEADTLPLLRARYGACTDRLVAAFRKAYPGKHLSDLLYVDTYFRAPTRALVARRAAEHCAPTYTYLLDYDMPIDGGKVAWHCSEIPFVFHNTDRTPLFNVPGETDRLEERICGSFVHFARYGTPQIPSLPEWLPSTSGDETVMLFDKVCELRHNFDAELQQALLDSGTQSVLTLKDSLVPDRGTVRIVH